MNNIKSKALYSRRRRRARARLNRGQEQRPRLSVFRSGKHIYAQVIDDVAGATLAAAALPAEAARCRLRAEPTREGELLEAMLDPRWEKRPTASWLAGEFADLVRRRCARSRL